MSKFFKGDDSSTEESEDETSSSGSESSSEDEKPVSPPQPAADPHSHSNGLFSSPVFFWVVQFRGANCAQIFQKPLSILA